MNIKARCGNPNNAYFHRYGGAGISVCERWLASFEDFFADMGPKPSPAHSIERRDGSLGYEPGNCEWATATAQARNRHTNQAITLDGVTRTVAEWANITGIGAPALYWRLHRGWSSERILSKPVAKLVEFEGERTTVPKLARRFGMSPGSLYYHLQHGVPLEDALRRYGRPG
jgi:hypothetical protein